MVVATLTLVCALPGQVSFVMIPVSLLLYVIAIVVLLTVVLIFATKRQPRRAASFLIALITPLLLWSPITWAVDCVHLGLTIGFGVGQLGSSSKPVGNGFSAYDWSVGLAGGLNTFLIRDVTDEIAVPMALHTESLNSENGFGEECAGRVRHLLDHYYVCRF